jgi:lipopolysaccharide/colanic/teichoic acid biosynthesis glycosyltransferase
MARMPQPRAQSAGSTRAAVHVQAPVDASVEASAPGQRFVRSEPQPPVESISERYAHMAHAGLEPRRVDLALRGLDVLVSGSILLVTAPLMAVIALAIRITAGAPVLYRGARVGRAGRTFTMLKFRTLTPDAEQRLGPYLGHELKARVPDELTPLGRALRWCQLDELPQLWNVLRGDMSLVGPRPVRPTFFEELCEHIPQYWQRLVVRPGLTGFAQLRMEREMTWSEKLAHDLEYIADRSAGLYMRVVLGTAVRLAGRLAGRGN